MDRTVDGLLSSMSQVRQLKQSERSCGSPLPTRSPDQTVPGFETVAAGEYHVLHGRCANRGRAIYLALATTPSWRPT